MRQVGGGSAVKDDFVESVEGWRRHHILIWGGYGNTKAVAEEDAGCAGCPLGGA